MSATKSAATAGMFRNRLFPIARVSRVPLRVGLDYGMTVQGRPMPAAAVPMPVRSSLAQTLLVHRFQIARNIRLLHGFGFAPGNPILRASRIPFQSRVEANTPEPQMTRFGQTPIPGKTPVFPRTGMRGSMGSPRRFPKAIQIIKNDYTPPVYGGQSAATNVGS